jgi:hypothetical protein
MFLFMKASQESDSGSSEELLPSTKQFRGRSRLIRKSPFFIAPVCNRTGKLSARADTSSPDTPLECWLAQAGRALQPFGERTVAELRYCGVADT